MEEEGLRTKFVNITASLEGQRRIDFINLVDELAEGLRPDFILVASDLAKDELLGFIDGVARLRTIDERDRYIKERLKMME
ncbi:hypothetical protein KJ693_05675 [bacterium]|nr:hypothetical protein [bacterium]MBU1614788.1 hypothetical protein [bacterium]